MWRHGDVLIAAVEAIPDGATRKDELVLAYGEMTGHAHRVEAADSAELWEHEGTLYLRVVTPSARIVHEEHKPITLTSGVYRVWKQREYTPGLIRPVFD
jgi:hypothetical protein